MDRIDIDDEDGDDVSTGRKKKESCPSVQTFLLPLTVPLFTFTFLLPLSSHEESLQLQLAVLLRLSSRGSERNGAGSVNGKSSKFVLHPLSYDILYNNDSMQTTFVALSVNF